MIRNVSRSFFFILAVCSLVFFTLMIPPQTAQASMSGPPYYPYNGGCIDSWGNTYPASYCNGTVGQTEGTLNVQTSTGQSLVLSIIGGQFYDEKGDKYCVHTVGSSSFFQSIYSPCDVPAVPSLLSKKGFSVSGGYSRTSISSAALGGSGARHSQTGSLSFGYAQDYGDWGFNVLLPIQRSFNNGAYSAFDTTSIGIAFSPFYHVLREQIHGIDLDVGAVLGQQYVQYEHKSALATTPAFNFTGFTNLSEGQLGLYTRVAKTVAKGGKLSLGTSVLNNYNYQNKAYLGRNATDWTTDLGYTQIIGRHTAALADIRVINIAQHPSDTSTSYGEVALGVSSRLNDRASLVFNLSQTFANPQWSSTGINLSFNWDLN